MNLVLSFVVLWSVFNVNLAIVTSSSNAATLLDSSKKEKRGTGYGHGPHSYEHYDNYDTYQPHPHNPGPHSIHPPPPQPPVHLGTTVVKKFAIIVHKPYPVEVPIYRPYPVPVARPYPVPHYVPQIVGIPQRHHHHSHNSWPHKW